MKETTVGIILTVLTGLGIVFRKRKPRTETPPVYVHKTSEEISELQRKTNRIYRKS